MTPGKLVIFGNCQGLALKLALNALPSVADRYRIILHDATLAGAELQESLPDYQDADIVLAQSILRWRNHPMRERLPASAKVILFPGLAHFGLWPFDSFSEGPDPAFVRTSPFVYGDRLMARLRGSVPDSAGSVPDPVERLRVYRELDWPTAPSLDDLRRAAAFDRSRVLRLDEALGYRLGRFVTDNLRRVRLFHTINHPAQALMVEFVAEVLMKAGLYDEAVRELDLDFLGDFQVPIHPLVCEALQLNWVSPGLKYRLTDNLCLDFDEYYRLYIERYG
jgi:hypothetical protein